MNDFYRNGDDRDVPSERATRASGQSQKRPKPRFVEL